MNRRLTMMLALSAALTASVGALNMAVNPFGAWHTRAIDPIFRAVAQEHLVVPYLIHTANVQTILLGTSRVALGMKIDQGERDGVMNAALAGASITQLARL